MSMFESLSDKLQRSFKALRGQGTITDENIAEALREIRIALIEADVSLSVVTDLVEHIRSALKWQQRCHLQSNSSRSSTTS